MKSLFNLEMIKNWEQNGFETALGLRKLFPFTYYRKRFEKQVAIRGTSRRDNILVPAIRFCIKNGKLTEWGLSLRL